MGRKPPKTASNEPLSYDSMESAAAGLNVPKSVLQRAKAKGAPGFRGSRVYPADLLPWLAGQEASLETDPNDKNAWQCRKLRLECQRLEDERQHELEKWVPRHQFESEIKGMVAAFQAEIYRLAGTLPPDLAGNSLADMESKLNAAFDGAFKLLSETK